MVGSRVSASSTTTSYSEGPLYLSSSEKAGARRAKSRTTATTFIDLDINLYVLKFENKKVNSYK